MKILFILIALLLIAVLTGPPAFGGIMIVVIAIWIVYLIAKATGDKKPTKAKAKEIKLEVTPGDSSSEYYTKIAGVQYRCDASDVGGFFGFIIHEPSNPKDPNAVAIYRADGKHLGYIPKDETEGLRYWCDRSNLFCVGYIAPGDHVPLYGKVKIFDVVDNRAMIRLAKYVKYLIENFGVKYIPEGLNSDARNKREWLEAMDNLIAEHEEAIGKLSASQSTPNLNN